MLDQKARAGLPVSRRPGAWKKEGQAGTDLWPQYLFRPAGAYLPAGSTNQVSSFAPGGRGGKAHCQPGVRWHLAAGIFVGALLLWSGPVQAYSARVVEPIVNLRAGPGTNYAKVGEAKAGSAFEVVGEAPDWLKIKLPSGQEAWVAGWLVEKDFSGEFWVTTPVAAGINIRSGPGTGYSILTRTQAGATYTILGGAGNWYKIQLPGGGEGWLAGWLTGRRSLELKDFSVGTPRRAVVPVVGKTFLRSLPDADAAILATVQTGTTMTYLESRQGWHKVSLPGPVVGWVNGVETKVYDLTAYETSPNYVLTKDTWSVREYPIGVIKEALVNLRSGPGTGYTLLGQLKKGTSFKLYESSGQWYRVGTGDGKQGWVAGWLTELKTVPALREVVFQRKTPFEKSLVLRGNFQGPPLIKELDNGLGLAVFLGSTGAHPALLDVNAEEVGELHLSSLGLLLRLKERSYYTIAKQTSSEIVLNFSALVEKVVTSVVNERRVVTFKTRGYVAPLARVIPGQRSLSITFPGVSFSGSVTRPNDQVIKDLVARRDAGGVTFDLSFDGLMGWVLPGWRPVPGTGETAAAQNTALGNLAASGTSLLGSPTVASGGAPSATSPGGSLPGNANNTGNLAPVGTAPGSGPVPAGLTVPAAGSYILRRGPNQVVLEVLPRGLKGKTIVLDPGHGGPDPGAIGPTGLPEKRPNLEITLRLKALLEKEGARVILTRSSDSASLPDNRADYWHERVVEELYFRSQVAEKNRADLFLSIHNNANNDPAKNGTATYYAPSSFNLDRSQYLAALVQEELLRGLGRTDNGVREAEFFVLKNTTVPSALAEVVFLSNPQEEGLLKDIAFLDRAAQSLSRAIRRYFGE